MQFRLLFHATAVLFLYIVFTKANDEPLSKEMNEVERIVGGSNAGDDEFPFVVALYYKGKFQCTASIISPNCILTAAHCVQLTREGAPEPVEMFYGIANVNRTSTLCNITFNELISHPQYGKVAENDIAILKTSDLAKCNKTDSKVCIPGEDACEKINEAAIAMGWGSTDRFDLNISYPIHLQKVDQEICSPVECYTSLIPKAEQDIKLCVKGKSFSGDMFTGVCNGDSGGPLVQNRKCLDGKNQYCQVGVASHVSSIVRCGKWVSGVFTRVCKYNDFIKKYCSGTCECCQTQRKSIWSKLLRI